MAEFPLKELGSLLSAGAFVEAPPAEHEFKAVPDLPRHFPQEMQAAPRPVDADGTDAHLQPVVTERQLLRADRDLLVRREILDRAVPGEGPPAIDPDDDLRLLAGGLHERGDHDFGLRRERRKGDVVLPLVAAFGFREDEVHGALGAIEAHERVRFAHGEPEEQLALLALFRRHFQLIA